MSKQTHWTIFRGKENSSFCE